MTTQRTNPFRTVAAAVGTVLICLSLAAPSSADEGAGTAAKAENLLRDAHAKTKTAATREDFQQILDLCEQAKAAKPSKPLQKYADQLLAWTHNRLGELYAEQAADLAERDRREQAAEHDAKAMEEFQAAVAANPDYWKALHNRGVSYALQHKFDEAIADFTRVVKLKPQYTNAWFNRGEIYFDLGRYEEAVSDYTQALQHKPGDYDTYIRRGHAYYHLRRFREAMSDYDRAAKIAPEKVEAIVNRGDAARSLGQWRQAAEDYRKAVTLDNHSGRAYQSVAWLMATCPEEKYRKADLAVQAAERAVTLSGSEDFEYLDTLAAAYANAGDFEKAQTTIVKAIKAAPEEQRAALRKRLELYNGYKPYRDRK